MPHVSCKGESRSRRYMARIAPRYGSLGSFRSFNTLASRFVSAVSAKMTSLRRYRAYLKDARYRRSERQITSFAIDSITELNKNISVMNIARFCHSRHSNRLVKIALQELEFPKLTLFPSGHRHYMKQGRRDTSGWPNIRNTSTGNLGTTISVVSYTYRDKCS